MNRRLFLATFIVGAPASMATSLNLKGLLNTSKQQIELKAGDVVIAKSDTNLMLPRNPKNGDSVQIVVENSTLHRPCTIQYETHAIVGDNEALVLDSIANFRLVFNARSDNWELG